MCFCTPCENTLLLRVLLCVKICIQNTFEDFFAMSKTHDQFVDEINIINPNVTILGKYTRAVDGIKVRCNTCGNVWSPRAYSLLQGRSCPKCSAQRGADVNHGKTKRKSDDEFKAELFSVNPNIIALSKYINNKSIIKCKCKRCGNIWEAKAYSLIQGHGCPRCAKSGTSFMEQFIFGSFEKVFGYNNVVSRDKSLIGMELDVFIPDLNFAIEPGCWLLHKKSVQRDKKKRDLCYSKGVRLVTIYDQFPKNQIIPFEKDCFVYDIDLNTSDCSELKALVYKLLSIVDINYTFSDSEWKEIENNARENAKSKTHESFVKELKQINDSIILIEEYKNANHRLLVKCANCGFEWHEVPASLLSGDGCKKCGTKKAHEAFVKNQELFEEQVTMANHEIEITGTYTGRHNPVKARCKVCGFEWEPVASSLLRGSNHKGWKTIHKNLLKNS